MREPDTGRPPSTTAALCPPKPKELLTATGAAACRAVPGPCASKLAVGGITPSAIDSAVHAASTAPAAPRMCPVTPLVEVTAVS